MTQGSKYTYAIFIDINTIYSEWGGGREIFSLPMRWASQKIIEKHWLRAMSSIVFYVPSSDISSILCSSILGKRLM